MKVGIVSTHRSWTSESEAWARYHLSLGFDRIYAFADDGWAPLVRASLAVDVTPCTPAYWASHTPKRGFGEFLDDIKRDFGTARWGCPETVMQRQALNACEALERAGDEGVDWLLHIDHDECFWCPGASVHAHFGGLQRAGIASAVYWNHEAVLLDEAGTARGHRRTSFKKHPNALTPAQREALPSLLSGKPYFTAHRDGKSAARVMPGTRPKGPHWFALGDEMLGLCTTCCPSVLHQPYKSASQFCDKHLSQGEFSTETLYGRPWTPPGVAEQAQHLCRNNDMNGLRALFSRAVTLSEAEKNRLEAGGFLLMPEVPLPFDDDWHAAGGPA